MIDRLGWGVFFIELVIWLAPVAFGLYRAVRRPPQQRLEIWISARGLNPNGPERQTIEPYLYQTRWYRTIGFIIGWSIPPISNWLDPSGGGGLGGPAIMAIAGYSVGVVMAELLRHPTTHGLAAVEPRRMSSYVPDLGVLQPRILVVAPIALAVLGHIRTGPADPQPLPYWVLGLIAPLAIGVVSLARSRIVSRPQSAATDWEIRADDAMRSNALRALVGVEFGIVMSAWLAISRAITATEPAIVSGAALNALVATSLLVGLSYPAVLLLFIGDDLHWEVPRGRKAASWTD